MNRVIAPPVITIRTRYHHYWGSAAYVAGRGYAICGAVITTPVTDDTELQQSVEAIEEVTCPTCRSRLAAIGRAYAKARRLHAIDW